MKAARLTPILLAVAIAAGFGTLSLGFHSGGVAECAGCHNMHGSVSTSSLLVGADASSACLTCHQQDGLTSPSSYHVSTASADLGAGISPFQRTPGGDFAWLKKTYTWTLPWGGGGTVAEAGETHGHNIVATQFGYAADTENTVAPGGGTFSASKLACTSCHDPHGQYRRIGGDTAYTIGTSGAPIIGSGSYATSTPPQAGEAVGVYRLLGGIGYKYDNAGAGQAFNVNPPHAVAPNSYNKSEASTQTKVAYGEGMSEWCASCHPAMGSGATNHHPVSEPLNTISGTLGNYAAYVKSGDLTGTNATSYLSLVPYEEASGDYALLKTRASSASAQYAGPDGGAGTGGDVSCISCHRAHASGFEYAVRWNPESEFLTVAGNWPGTDNGASAAFHRGRKAAEMQAAYYDRPAGNFASYQRSLCNKCHAQD